MVAPEHDGSLVWPPPAGDQGRQHVWMLRGRALGVPQGVLGLLVLGFSLLLLPLMVSSQSLWIDEAYSALYARTSGMGEFWNRLSGGIGSESQMPLGMMAAWIGGRLTGTSEWFLRAVNLPWGAVSLGCFYVLGRRFRMPWLPLLLVVQPFFWFYMNEARPYVLQIAAGSLMLLAIVELSGGSPAERTWVPALATGGVLLCGSSLLGFFPFVSFAIAAAFLMIFRKIKPSGISLALFAAMGILLVLLGGYYLWTLLHGVGGAKLWKVGWGNIAMTFYDLGGFAGLGPDRRMLRGSSWSFGGLMGTFGLFSECGIALLALFYALTIGLIVRERILRERLIGLSVAILVGTLVMIFTASKAVAFPFWGRHVAALLPVLVFVVGWTLRPAFGGARFFKRTLLVLLMTALAFSSLRLRFSECHRKDDYRNAAAEALRIVNAPGIVWWAADPAAALYYGLNLRENGFSGGARYGAWHLANPSAQDLLKLPVPDAVILSKPEIYDHGGEILRWVAGNGYRPARSFPAFMVYVR